MTLKIKPLVCPRDAGEYFACGWQSERRLMRYSWEADKVYGNCTLEEFIDRATNIVTPLERVEGYLYLKDSLEFIAQAIYQRVVDLHYGLVALPISVLVAPEYRGNVQVLRELSKLKENVVGRLGVSKYIDVKNVSTTEQVSKLKRARNYGKGI